MNIEKPNEPLTAALAELPNVRDRGFTERVMYRVQLRKLRRRTLYFSALCCGIVGIVLSLPLERLITPIESLLLDANADWADLTKANQLIQALDGYLQIANFNTVVALGVGAVLLVLATFSLLQD